MKKLLLLAIPLLALFGCSSPLEPQPEPAARAAKAKAVLEAATNKDKDPDGRLSAN